MRKFLLFAFAPISLFLAAGCATNKLPAEDIEVLEKYEKTIKILRSPQLLPNTPEKYDAAKHLIENVDLHFTRETSTIDKLFYHRDAIIDDPTRDDPIFTFTYQKENKSLHIRFFTYKMFVTRVEITEK